MFEEFDLYKYREKETSGKAKRMLRDKYIYIYRAMNTQSEHFSIKCKNTLTTTLFFFFLL